MRELSLRSKTEHHHLRAHERAVLATGCCAIATRCRPSAGARTRPGRWRIACRRRTAALRRRCASGPRKGARSHLARTAIPTLPSASRRFSTRKARSRWGADGGNEHPGCNGRAAGAGARIGSHGAAACAQGCDDLELLAELYENLGSLETARAQRTAGQQPVAAAGGDGVPRRARRLRERQGRLRHAARSAAPDPSGQASKQPKAQTEAQMRLADIERLLGEEL